MNHNIEIDDATRNAIVICNEPLCFRGPRGRNRGDDLKYDFKEFCIRIIKDDIKFANCSNKIGRSNGDSDCRIMYE